MREYVNVEKLIEKIQAMENRGSWLTGRDVRQEDLVNQIIGTIVRIVMEDGETETIHKEKQSEEVGVGYQMSCISEKYFSASELMEHDFKFKEILKVPTKDGVIPFRVEHVTDEKAYLVVVDSIWSSPMTYMDNNLDSFMKKLPEDLLNICGEIEHKVNGQLIRKSKVTLLSYGNITGCENCDGVDDMQFDGLKTAADRCKNDRNGETCSYWVDTPYIYEDWNEDSEVSESERFYYISTSGYLYNSMAYRIGDNFPVIAIKRKKKMEGK